MLTDKLRVFYDAVNIAVGKYGKNAPAIADDVIASAFPETIAAAENEGADSMLRNGVISKIRRVLSKDDNAGQADFAEIDEGFNSLVKQLHGHSHYVPSLCEYVHIGTLIASPEFLNEARIYKRQKGVETLAEAEVLDQIYFAVTENHVPSPEAA